MVSMLYKDLTTINNTIHKLAKFYKQEEKKLDEHVWFVINSISCCIYNSIDNNIVSSKNFYAYDIFPCHAINPYTKTFHEINFKYAPTKIINCDSTEKLEKIMIELLSSNMISKTEFNRKIYIDANATEKILSSYLSKSVKDNGILANKTTFVNIYNLYKKMEDNLPKRNLFFYFINPDNKVNSRYNKNIKLLPILTIKIGAFYSFAEKALDIVNYTIDTFNALKFKYLKQTVFNTTERVKFRFGEDYVYNFVNVLFDNEIVMDLLGIFIVDKLVHEYF